MKHPKPIDRTVEWEEFWNNKSKELVSHYEYDRGHSPRATEIEKLAHDDFIEFVAPSPTDVILDAGCGTGVNILRLHPHVHRIIGMDYIAGTIQRCRERLAESPAANVDVFQGNITSIPLPTNSAHKVLCMSVLQYVDDSQLRQAFEEFNRVLIDDGVLLLHVKNSSSLYLSTLRVAKRAKRFLTGRANLEYIRSLSFYKKELTAAGFDIESYSSKNIFTIDLMPRFLVEFLQGYELRNRNTPFFRLPFVRAHGSDLHIRARLRKRK